MKIAASVVFYNPTVEVKQNISTYANSVDLLIVVDNSPTPNQELLKGLQAHYKEKMVLICNQANLGIATALNQACDEAIKQECEWIVTMDQDSAFVNFTHYKNCLLALKNSQNIALLAANTTRDAKSHLPQNPTCDFEEKTVVITSANILNLQHFNAIGRFDDALFIDLVDYDYCAKARVAKLQILFFKDALVEHNHGEVFKRKNFLTRKIKEKREHNPQRAYYIARNYLYMAKKYHALFPQEFGIFKIFNIVFIHDVTKILLYEANKWQKIRAKGIALLHFLQGRVGKYNLASI